MSTTKQTRPCRKWLFAAAILSMSAASCAAPDAMPGPDEPVAGNGGQPQWGIGLNEPAAATEQSGWDIALDPTTDTVVTTIGFVSAIKIPGLSPTETFTSIGSRDGLVLKYAATGSQPLWAVPIASPAEFIRSYVDIDFQGNTIVVGGYSGAITIGSFYAASSGLYDAFIAKLGPDGTPAWLQPFGEATGNQFITDVATDGEGNIIVVGFAQGPAFDFGPGVSVPAVSGDDIFVAKFDSAGKALWGNRVGRAGSSEWYLPTACVAVSRVDGSIIVGGSHSDTLVFPSQQVGVVGNQDGFVVKLDAQGNAIWQKAFGTKDRRQRVTSVSYNRAGEVLLTGAFTGSVSLGGDTLEGYLDTYDLLVAKLDAQGQHVWSRGYGYDGAQVGTHVSFDTKGNAVVVGTFDGVIELFGKSAIVNANVDGSTDVFTAKFSPEGTPLWGRAYGDRDYQEANGTVLWKTPAGEDRAIIIGTNTRTLDLGPDITPIVSEGVQDVFLMSIAY